MSIRADSQLGNENKISTSYQDFNISFPERRALLIAIDITLVIAAMEGVFLFWQLANRLGFELVAMKVPWSLFLIMPVAWCTLSWLNDLYDIPSSTDKVLTAKRIAVVSAILLITYLVTSLLSLRVLPNPLFGFALFTVLSVIVVWRWAYASLFSAPPFLNRVLIVGKGERACTIAQALQRKTTVKYQVVGFIDDEGERTEKSLDNISIVGSVTELPLLVKQFHVSEIVIAVERELNSSLFQQLIACQAQGVSISPMVDLYEKLHRSIPVQYIHRGWALHAMQAMRVSDPLQRGLKRLLDLILGMIGLMAFVLVLPPVTLAIYLDSPGPIFYRQVRSGRGGQPFSIIKFRTMRTDAERDGKARWAAKDDPRITRVGRFLRQTRLDELPQVLNVLHGEMSTIGPRPERPELIADLQRAIPYYDIRLIVKPGLTGWAQIHYGYGNTMEDALAKLEYDFYYLRYWSLWLDLYIVFRTIGVILKFQGY